MTQYINVKGYSDTKSFRVFDINGNKAMAIEVEKRIQPNMVPGGFSAICLNNDDFNKTNEVFDVDGAVPFEIECRKGIWGKVRPQMVFCFPYNGLKDPEQFIKDNPGTVIEEKGGIKWLVGYDRTSKGKIKTRFEKLGKLCDTCRYYYDYNF